MKLFSLIAFLLASFNCFGNTYFISPTGSDADGNGSASKPWQTLRMATTQAIKPGDIIHIKPGVYTESIASILEPGVSIEGEGDSSFIQSTITNQFGAIIIATSPEGTNGNQHISGIKLSGNGRRTSWGIEIRGRSNFQIYNCTIVDFDDTGIFWGGRNDNEGAAPTIYATGNSFYNNTLTNCAKYEGYGRGCLTIGGQEGMLIYNNTISQTGRTTGTNGWPIKGGNEGFLKGCKIYNNKIIKERYDGTSWDFAIELFDVSGLEIYGNRVVGCIDLNRQSKGKYGYSVYIHDNIIGPDRLQPLMENGITLEYSTENALIEKNEFRNVGTVVFFTCRPFSTVENVIIKNNKCENIGVSNGSHEGFAIRVTGDPKDGYFVENLVIDSNRFIGNSAEKPFWGVGIIDAVKAKSVFVRNNTLQNFSAGCITANPGSNVEILLVENNTLVSNGYNNKPSFIGGSPASLVFKNNKEQDGQIFTKSNLVQNIVRPFYYDIKRTSLLELIAVIAGIISVWLSKKENIYVYPVGLVNTVIYIFLSFDQGLFGEASVNLYYTIMSILGWIIWSKRDAKQHRVVRVTKSSTQQLLLQFGFFVACYAALFAGLTYLKSNFYAGAIPWADAFASATAFTAMWLMTKKKVESWYWWIATNIASIPLYFVKHFVLTSVYYGILLVLAFMGLQEWKKRARTTRRK